VVAAGINVNVTLLFSEAQYLRARNAVWRGAQKRDSLAHFKSVFSIFVSRLDVYAEKKAPELSAEAQGMVGILNAKRIWKQNQEFWQDKPTPLQQEMIFASTGTKKPEDPKWKYVQAFAGSDIETNPPETNEAVEASGIGFKRAIDEMPPPAIIDEIDQKIDWQDLERTLMDEGLVKFAEPQKALLKLIDEI
jgi:transaldolase